MIDWLLRPTDRSDTLLANMTQTPHKLLKARKAHKLFGLLDPSLNLNKYTFNRDTVTEAFAPDRIGSVLLAILVSLIVIQKVVLPIFELLYLLFQASTYFCLNYAPIATNYTSTEEIAILFIMDNNASVTNIVVTKSILPSFISFFFALLLFCYMISGVWLTVKNCVGALGILPKLITDSTCHDSFGDLMSDALTSILQEEADELITEYPEGSGTVEEHFSLESPTDDQISSSEWEIQQLYPDRLVQELRDGFVVVDNAEPC